jgi:hypothetical protein
MTRQATMPSVEGVSMNNHITHVVIQHRALRLRGTLSLDSAGSQQLINNFLSDGTNQQTSSLSRAEPSDFKPKSFKNQAFQA